MARKVKPDQASKTIADAFALSHFFVTNVIVILGECTNLLGFIGSKHPGMDLVREYISAPATHLADVFWWNGDNAINLWLSIQGVIILASLIYWTACYLATRLILLIAD